MRRVISFVIVPCALAAFIQPFLDYDGDGLANWQEFWNRTNLLEADSDSDGLSDRREMAVGTNPWRADSDGDGYSDSFEIEWGLSPTRDDTDMDGLSDFAEPVHCARLTDCDGDGIWDSQEAPQCIQAPDCDSDGLPDGLEPSVCLLLPDCDSDGILDGLELGGCIQQPDCDSDRAPDGLELQMGLLISVADSYGNGWLDAASVRWGDPNSDADEDGIPDSWESPGSAFPWGEWRPRPGQRDLLVEFIVLQPPAMQAAGGVDYSAVYRFVSNAFSEEGVVMHSVETLVAAPRAPLWKASADELAGYAESTRGVTNPFVYEVVLSPGYLDRPENVGGWARVSRQWAEVDTGRFLSLDFQLGERSEKLDGAIADWVLNNREDRLSGAFSSWSTVGNGILIAGRPSGRIHSLEYNDWWWGGATACLRAGETDCGYQVARIHLEDADRLAEIVLHEIGHSLGLCHAHEADCRASWPSYAQMEYRQSPMSYERAGESARLSYLPIEWDTVMDAIRCPSQLQVARLVLGHPEQDVLKAKITGQYYFTESDSVIAAMAAVRNGNGCRPAEEAVGFRSALARPSWSWMGHGSHC